MKTYVLNPTGNPGDQAPPFVQRAMTWAKATNEIVGIVRGMLADGILVEEEAKYLKDWMLRNREVLNDPVVRSLAARVFRVCEGGIAKAEELAELKVVLADFAREDEKTIGLPLDDPAPPLYFKNKLYCFTGTFAFGTRRECWIENRLRGANNEDVLRTSHYLVVGSRVSNGWVNQTYGSKIQTALASQYQRIAIIHEEHWLRALESNPPTVTPAQAEKIRLETWVD